MLIQNKLFFIFIYFTFFINCGSPNNVNEEKNVLFNGYFYSDSYGNYIIKIPQELPLKIVNLDNVFTFHQLKENDLIIEKFYSLLKNGSFHVSKTKQRSKKHPLVLFDSLIYNEHLFYYNEVSFETISKNSNSMLFDKKDLILKSKTISDNFDMHYLIYASIRISNEEAMNAYHYAKLLSKIELLKLEN